MAKIAQKHQDKLKTFKEYVENWHDYFDENNKRFQEYKRLVFDTSVTSQEKEALMSLGKPTLEFNILEAYISRLRGNFAEHEPSVMVKAAEGLAPNEITPSLLRTVNFVEDHLRYIFSSAANDNLEFDTYTNALSGGFAGLRVGTEYINPQSFDQRIYLKQIHDPTTMGFDPMAELSHKGDGKYAFEVIALTEEDFTARYGKEVAKDITFTRAQDAAFNWSYASEHGDQKVAVVCMLYEKVMKREKIAKLSNGKVIYSRNYPELLAMWDQMRILEQAPQIVKERYTDIETIWLYEFCENQVFKAYETSYTHLPIIFVDGNSSMIRRTDSGSLKQMTRPYVYHAKGVQKLKNFAGQTIGAEIEQMVQHKFMAAIEAIPEDYIDGYINPQKYQTLLYNAFYDKDPDKPIPKPEVVPRVPTPPLVESIFNGTDAVTQAILGSYDAQQGLIGNKDLSGKAIQAGAMQSDQTSVPYLVNYIRGLNRAAQIVVSLIPKYYVTPRSVPIMKSNGLRDFQMINESKNPMSINTKYEPRMLDVNVEMGINSAMQKQIALETISKLMSASESFNQFINDEGLEVLLDNIDIRGGDELRYKATQYMEAKKQAAQAQAGEPSPEEKVFQEQINVEREKTQQKMSEAELKYQTQMQEQQAKWQQSIQEMAIKQEELDLKWAEVMAKIDASQAELALKEAKVTSEVVKDLMEVSRDEVLDVADVANVAAQEEREKE